MARWKKDVLMLILPVLSGLLLAVSFPTLMFGKKIPDLGFLAWFSFLPLFYSICGKSLSGIFRNTFITGFVFNVVSLSWLYTAIHDNTNHSVLYSIACLGFIIVVSGIYIGFAFFSAHWVSSKTKVPLCVSLPMAWIMMEYLIRFFPFGGFPWLNLGYSQQNYLYLIQSADIVGVLGISFLILLVNILIFDAVNILLKGDRHFGYVKLAVIVGLLILNLGYGIVRVTWLESRSQSLSEIKVALIPGNVSQEQKWDPNFSQAIIEKYRKLFFEASSQQADLIIWPETSIPYQISDDLRSMPQNVVSYSSTPLLAGAVTVDHNDQTLRRNSVLLIQQGQVTSRYDKIHLVPLMEYVPSLVGRVKIQGGNNFNLFKIGNNSFGTQICFEDIFPELTRDLVRQGAQFIVNLSSDAWYVNTSGVLQHRGFSIFRAIENRVSFIRVANEGVSSIVNPSGKILKETTSNEDEQWVSGVIKPYRGFSLYSYFGDAIMLLGILFLIGSVLWNLLGSTIMHYHPKRLLQSLGRLIPLIIIFVSLPVFAESIPEPSQSSGGGYNSYTPFQFYSNGEAVDLASGNLVLNFTDFSVPGKGKMDLTIRRYFNSTKSVEQGDIVIDPSIFTGYQHPPSRHSYKWGENLNNNYACAYLRYLASLKGAKFAFQGSCNIENGAYVDQFGYADMTEQGGGMSFVKAPLAENITPVQTNNEQQFYPLGKVLSDGDNLKWIPPNNVWGFAASQYVGAVVFRNVNPFAKEGDSLTVLIRSDGGLDFFDKTGKPVGVNDSNSTPKISYLSGSNAVDSILKVVEDLKSKLPKDQAHELGNSDLSHNSSNDIDIDKIVLSNSGSRTLTFSRYKHLVLHSQLYARNIKQWINSKTKCDDTHGCYQEEDLDHDGYYDPTPYTEYRVKTSNIPHWAVDFFLITEDRNEYGNAVSYNYTNLQYPGNYTVNITDTLGRPISLQFGAHNIIRLLAPGGRQWLYYHNGDGQIRRVVDPQGNETLIRYSSGESNLPLIRHWPLGQTPNFFMEIRYPTGGVLRYEAVKGKDDVTNGEILTTEFPDDRDSSVYYQKYISINKSVISREIITMLYERDGAVFKYIYSNPALLTGKNENTTPLLVKRELNAGYADSIIDEYKWQFSATGNMANVFGLLSATTTEGGASYTTNYTYNADGSVASYVDPLGQTTSLEYESDAEKLGLTRKMTRTKTKADGSRETIEAIYYRTGKDICSGQAIPDAQVNRISVRAGGGQEEIIQEYCFDVNGNITKQTNLANPATKYHFDENGAFLKQIENESGITSLFYNTDTGDLAQITGPEGRSIQYQHNSLGQVTRISYPNGSYISYQYDVRYNTNNVSAENRISTDIYDLSRNQHRNTIRTFDGMERLKLLKKGDEEIGYLYGPNKEISSIAFPGNKKYNINYDGLGRVVSVVYPGGKEIGYSYRSIASDDGKFANKLDINLNGRLYSTLYRDAKEKVVRSVQYPVNGAENATKYRYDEFDNLIEVTTPEGLSIKNIYDQHNRLIGRIYPNGDRVDINNISNESGLLDSFIIQDSTLGPVTAKLQFDERNRVTHIGYPLLNGQKSNDYSIEYADNRVSSIVSANDQTEFNYTPDGALSEIIQNISGTNLTSTFQYGEDGFGTTYWMDYPDGNRVFYITDDRGRVSQVKMGSISGKTIASMEYKVSGELEAIHFGNKVSNLYDYDASGRIIQLQIQKEGELINQISYVYDEKGNKSSITYLDGSRTEFGYDGLNRITQARYFKPEENIPYNTQIYAYDGDGNRTVYSDAYKQVNYSYQKGLLTKVLISPQTERTLEYDIRGNLLKEKEVKQGDVQFSKNFEYDFQNRLIKATVQDKDGANITSEYSYDYASRRISKATNGKKDKYYVYGKAIDPLMELNKNGEVDKLFIYVGGRKIASLQNEQLQYFHLDERGNVLHTTDDAGHVTETLRYDPFGNLNFHVGLTENDYTFGSKEYDKTTGLIYYGARYYDPETGRFITRDPMEQGINHYIFAKNNPLIFEEYFGMGDVVSDVVGAVVGVVVGVVTGVITGNPVAGIAAGIATAASIIGRNHTTGSGGGVMINIGFSGGAPGINPDSRISIGVGPTPAPGEGSSSPVLGGSGGCVNNQVCLVIGENGPQVTGDGGRSFVGGSSGGWGSSGGVGGGSGIGGGGPGGNGLVVETYLNSQSGYAPINSNLLNTPNVFPNGGDIGGGGAASEGSPNTSLTNVGLPEISPDFAGSPVQRDNDPFVIPETDGNFSGGGSTAPIPEDINLPLNFNQQNDTPLPTVQNDLSNISANNTVADPVILYSGDLLQVMTDLKIPGRGIDFEFTRTYRSRLNFDGPLGFGWDHNYNKRLVTMDGGNVRRFDGNARYDDYKRDANGVYISPAGKFDRLRRNSDETFTIRDRFGLVNDYRKDGFIHSITDRNGNKITFDYITVAGETRLGSVVDTLGRTINYNYNGNAKLTNISDFTGRVVRFDYDAHGDLVAVHSPVVDSFPIGKVTRYSYSTGFDEISDHLNHNLLSVTDPSGQVYLQNEYSSSDRVIKQYLGEKSFTFSYHRKREFDTCSESSDPKLIVSRTTVTDRNGNDTEIQFNCQGNPIRSEEFTRGLRPDDPASFVTTYEYNINGLVTKLISPEGNTAEYVYDTKSTGDSTLDKLYAGNLLKITRTEDVVRAMDNSPLITTYNYDPIYNKVNKAIDAKGKATTAWLDYQEGTAVETLADILGTDVAKTTALVANTPLMQGDLNEDGFASQSAGNVVRIDYPAVKLLDDTYQIIQTRLQYNSNGQIVSKKSPGGSVDEFTYQDGYLHQIIKDAGGVAVTNTFDYDRVGNVISFTDGNQKVYRFTVNNLNQVVEEIAPAPLNYKKKIGYDANNNIARVEVPGVTTVFEYNVLNRLVLKSTEPETGHKVVTEYQYDGNENLTRVIQPEGNSTTIIYDERDLPYQITKGFETNDASTTTISYDGNRNKVKTIDGKGNVTTFVYDGFDRPVKKIDALGNEVSIAYDPTDNIGQINWRGPPNILIKQVDLVYDEVNRLIARQDALIDSGSVLGQRVTKYQYNPNNKITQITDGEGNITGFGYDGLGRLLSRTDAVGNKWVYGYDGNNNLKNLITHEVNSATGSEDIFTTTAVYDALNRPIEVIDNAGHKKSFEYDSHGNLIFASDSKDTSGLDLGPNAGRGNVTRYNYDGLDRLTSVIKEVRDNGAGNGQLIREIATKYAWDDNSRLTSITDAKDQITSFEYDPLDRRIGTVLADGSKYLYAFDKNSNVARTTSPSGFVVDFEYDVANRLVDKSINRSGKSVGKEHFGYDPLGKIILAQNWDEANIQISEVSKAYDSYGRLVQETQNGYSIANHYDNADRRDQLSYPSGNVVNYTFDNANRLTNISTAGLGTIVNFAYAGVNRYSSKDLINGTSTEFTYDQLKRVVSNVNRLSGGGLIAGYEVGYDKADNRLFEKFLHETNNGNIYQYDSLYRLNQSSYDVPNVSTSVSLPSSDITFTHQTTYTIDDVHNWITKLEKIGPDDPASNIMTSYDANIVNQYEQVGNLALIYDKDGNLVEDGDHLYAYDYRNLLTEVRKKTDSSLIVSYKYDTFGRRISKLSVATAAITNYIYDGWNVIEERDGSSVVLASYVYGSKVDEPVSMERNGEIYFYHADTLGNIIALTNGGGNLVEKYKYDSYGKPEIHDAGGALLETSAVGNTYFYTAREYDPEINLYNYRLRTYNPDLGRFMQRDPLGYIDSMNAYAYSMSNPVNFKDPFGLSTMAGNGNSSAGSSFGSSFRDDLQILGLIGNQMSSAAIMLGGGVVGAAEGVWGMASGLVNAVASPVETANGILNAVINYEETASAISGWASGQLDILENGSSFEQGRVLGNLGANLFAGELVAGAVGRLGNLTRIDEAAGIAGRVSNETRALVPYWPANDGFLAPATQRTLGIGTRIDRYGSEFGRFVAPEGTPLPMRSLFPEVANRPYNAYEVIKPFDVNSGVTTPWFGQPGFGTQFKLPMSVNELVEQGFLGRITK